MDADFDNNAEVYWFRSGLADATLDELTHTTAETDLDKFIAQCILIDTRLREREVERRRRPTFPSSPDHPVSHLLTPWFSILLRQTNDMVRSQQKKGRDESKTTSVSTVVELDIEKRPARLKRETGRPVNAGVDGRPS